MTNHEIAVPTEGTYTPGGNPLCTCGELIGPGQFTAHLQDVIAKLEDEIVMMNAGPIFVTMDRGTPLSDPMENCFKCAQCLDQLATPTGMPFSTMQMIVCTDCGNKRCPKATNHRNDCTGSNDPGQEGSRYS